ATLLAFELTTVGDAKLIAFSIGAEGQLRPLGQPLTARESPSVWLVAHPVELEASASLVLTASALTPRSRSWLTATTTYDEAPLGRAALVPSAEGVHDERRVPIEKDGRVVGSARVALDIVEAP
ncbi:MAG: hypothetical protein K0S65_4047, partial [Labilithrix sp.]|nr:hypothetical protein [Labilithrix sp.]